MDAAGVIYVSDIADARVWVFGPDGRSLRSIGRKGRGPGEFESPTGVAIGPDGNLYVRDGARVSQFGIDPQTRRLTRFARSFRGPTLADWASLNQLTLCFKCAPGEARTPDHLVRSSQLEY
jgi:DNA-binding beta-propeller fold protein YncE